MPELEELLELSKSIAAQAGQSLLSGLNQHHKNYFHSVDYPKEIKALADIVLEKEILQVLGLKGLPILSEESGYIPGQQDSKYWFIVDPLDGTFNFVKGLGPSAVSIALWEDQKPIFGVIYNIVDRKLIWGGAGIGAYCDGQPISVSKVAIKNQASICTGFPVRLDLENETVVQSFWRMVRLFAKVRMFGSAAVSLVYVARGVSDVYFEENIMLWDVAAGLAIVEGAGGTYALKKTSVDWSYRVFASNECLSSGLVDLFS